MNKPKLVYVSSRWPWPVSSGRQRMIAQALDLASATHHVTLIALVGIAQKVGTVPSFVDEAYVVPRPGTIGAALGFVSDPSAPLQSHLFVDGRVSRGVARILSRLKPDVVMLDMIRLAGLEKVAREYVPGVRVVLDMDDRLSERYGQMMRKGSGNILGAFAQTMPLPLRVLAALAPYPFLAVERRLVSNAERDAALEMDAIAFVSTKEASEYRRWTGESGATIAPVPPVADVATFRDRDFSAGRRFVFLGNCDYAPNREALRILETLARSVGDEVGEKVVFEAAGAGTETEPLKRVHGLGFVDDLDAFLGADAIMVVPLRTGTGIKTKLLDAMARGVPIVSTPKGVEGLSISDGNGASVMEESRLPRFLVDVARGAHDAALSDASALAHRVAATEHSREFVSGNLLGLFDGGNDNADRARPRPSKGLSTKAKIIIHGVTMAFADVAAISASLMIAFLLAKYITPVYTHLPFSTSAKAISDRLPVGLPIMAAGLLYAFARGHYTERVPFWSEAREVISMAALCLAAEAFVQFSINHHPSRAWSVVSWAAFVPACLLLRSWMKWSLLRSGLRSIPVVLFGDRDDEVRDAVESERLLGFDVVETVPTTDRASALVALGRWRGSFPILVMGGDTDGAALALANAFSREGIPFALSPPLGGLGLASMRSVALFGHDAVLLTDRRGLSAPFARLAKRAFDVAGALAGLAILGPVAAAMALLVMGDGGEAFFAHDRVGRHGRPFRAWKVRSMKADAARVLAAHLAMDDAARIEWHATRKLKDDPRVTPLGRFLRKNAVDEIPQLWNVLIGEMSLVGPRPIVPNELAAYGAAARSYLDVRPGLTGLWQVSGRSETTYARRVALDSWYVRNWSLWVDVVILLKTVPALLGRKGAY